MMRIKNIGIEMLEHCLERGKLIYIGKWNPFE